MATAGSINFRTDQRRGELSVQVAWPTPAPWRDSYPYEDVAVALDRVFARHEVATVHYRGLADERVLRGVYARAPSAQIRLFDYYGYWSPKGPPKPDFFERVTPTLGINSRQWPDLYIDDWTMNLDAGGVCRVQAPAVLLIGEMARFCDARAFVGEQIGEVWLGFLRHTRG